MDDGDDGHGHDDEAETDSGDDDDDDDTLWNAMLLKYSQRAQYFLIQEYSLNHIGILNII